MLPKGEQEESRPPPTLIHRIPQGSTLQLSRSSKIGAVILLLVLAACIIFSLTAISTLIIHSARSIQMAENNNLSAVFLPENHAVNSYDYNDIHSAKVAYLTARSKLEESSQEKQMNKIEEVLAAKFDLSSLMLSQRLDAQGTELLENGHSKFKFPLPPNLWIYLSVPMELQTYSNFLIITANSRLAHEANLTLNFLTSNNYANFLSKGTAERLEQEIAAIHASGHQMNEMEDIVKCLVVATVFEELGGVMVEEHVLLLENLEWLEDISSNIFINRGSQDVEPQLFAFHSVEHSSPLLRQPKTEMLRVKQYMRVFPAIEQFFLAGCPHSRFLTDLKSQIYQNSRKTDSELRQIAHILHKKNAFKLNANGEESIWTNLFTISSHQIILRQQENLLSANSSILFAIDSYGLKTINKYYFPYKLHFIFREGQAEKAYAHLAKHILEQLEATVGPLRYAAVVTPREEVELFLQEAKSGNSKFFVIKGSFLQTFLFNEIRQPFIINNREVSFTLHTYPKWTKLPKIVWLFWDKGLTSSHATNQLAKRNIQKYAGKAGFKVIEVNQTNLKDYIGLTEIQRIQETLYSNGRSNKFDQTYSDLVRLALLKRHGGVYMDASFLLLQDLSWLVNIAAYPSHYVFNRYGELPSVFMFFNPVFASQYDEWHVDSAHNTKAHWHLAYENNFIACEAENELITAWYDTLLRYLSQPYASTEQEFRECGIWSHKWSTPSDTYLLPMDALKCVVGNKEKELLQTLKGEVFSSASHYFKIWSMSGYNGVQKFRKVSNFESPDSEDNLFFRRNSKFFVESLMGKPKELIKLYSIGNQELNNFMKDNIDGKIFSQIHHESYFNRFMLSLRDDDEEFIVINDNLLIKEKNIVQ